MYPYLMSSLNPTQSFIPNYQLVQPQLIQQPQPIQQPVQTTQTPIQQPVQQSIQNPTISPWQWKTVSNYHEMTLESVPFDGTPVLYMLQNESIFYIVRMVDGKKMVNGFQFNPLEVDSTQSPPQEEQTVESRLANVETNLGDLMEMINKLIEEKKQNESSNESAEPKVKRKSITE